MTAKTGNYILGGLSAVLLIAAGIASYKWQQADTAVKAAIPMIPQTALLPKEITDYLPDAKAGVKVA